MDSMSICEMCGKDTSVVSVDVEGVFLMVCGNCSKYGTKTQPKNQIRRGTYSGGNSSSRSEKPEFKLVARYSNLLRSARERKGLSQDDFAKSLNERASVVAKWESGSMKPSVETARRIGRILSLNLIEKDEIVSRQENNESSKKKSTELTVGDFIKIRTRK